MIWGKARVLALLLAVFAFLLYGCAPSRTLLKDSEAEQARAFFTCMAEEAVFPVTASYSGLALLPNRAPMPFIVGLNAVSPDSEKLGFYDPMGGPIAFLSNDRGLVLMTRGPMADLAGLDKDRLIAVGPISLGRILSGAPGYRVSGGEVMLGDDGGWVLADGSQTLFSDPGRNFLAKAEYRFAIVKVTVEYPDRDFAPPPTVSMTIRGTNILLRRDL